MSHTKEHAKQLLRAIKLYEAAHHVHEGWPGSRIACWNAGYRLAGAVDGLPIPPTSLIHLVTNSYEVARFLHGGQLDSDSILSALALNGYSLGDFDNVLDFGCGCGRVMRHWKSFTGPHFFGSDYNPALVGWCRNYLGHVGVFGLNQLEPGLAYPSESFDFIYALSVFTHLTEALQLAWMDEMARLLTPGGLLLITVHGRSRLSQLGTECQDDFLRGHMVVIHDGAAGTNLCGAYHPETYVRAVLARSFDVVDFLPSAAHSADQDVYLLRKGTHF